MCPGRGNGGVHVSFHGRVSILYVLKEKLGGIKQKVLVPIFFF